MSDVLPRVSGIILAGGQSQRMGRDKAFIEFQGKPLIAHVVDRVRQVADDVILVANDAAAFADMGARIVGDIYPGNASLGGLYSGLHAAREEYALAVACDMPFLNVELLRYLVSLAPQHDIVIPRAEDPSGKTPRSRIPGHAGPPPPDQVIARRRNLHPAHAVYSRRCLPAILANLQAGNLRLVGFHDTLNVRVVEGDEIDRFDRLHLSFFNVNTPSDLQLALRLQND